MQCPDLTTIKCCETALTELAVYGLSKLKTLECDDSVNVLWTEPTGGTDPTGGTGSTGGTDPANGGGSNGQSSAGQGNAGASAGGTAGASGRGASAQSSKGIVKKTQRIVCATTMKKNCGPAFALGAKAKTKMTYVSSDPKIAQVSSRGMVIRPSMAELAAVAGDPR